MKDERRALAARLTVKAAEMLLGLSAQKAQRLEEMRFYAGQRACFVFDGQGETQNAVFSQRDVDELVTALCGYSRYAYEAQLARGYIPLEGGCRAGVCGRLTRDQTGTARLSSPTSVCIRIARDVPGAGDGVWPYLLDTGGRVRRVLLLGAPGCGKTTVLRDAAKKLAASGVRVAVCDEREELFPNGEANLDVMRGADKAAAIQMLLRAMAPQAIVCDELGDMRDVQALKDAARCGAGLLASAHAGAFEDVLRRPALRRLHDAAAFERYLLLGRHGRLAAAYDAAGRLLLKGGDAHERRGHDGDDFPERDRLRSGGWRNAARSMASGAAPMSFADERSDPLRTAASGQAAGGD